MQTNPTNNAKTEAQTEAKTEAQTELVDQAPDQQDVSDLDKDLDKDLGKNLIKTDKTVIWMKDICKSYKMGEETLQVLKNVSIAVEQGETTGGHNNMQHISGKFYHIILHLLRCRSTCGVDFFSWGLQINTHKMHLTMKH